MEIAGETRNLFFALWPDDDVRARIAKAAAAVLRRLDPGGRPIRSARLHLTLRFLGGDAAPRDRDIARAIAAADRVRADAFDLVLDVADAFRSRGRPCWLGCSVAPEPLRTLVAALDVELAAEGWPSKSPRSDVAHVTIVRDAERAVARTAIDPVAWPVRDFVLIESRLGASAAYEVLRRWPLAPR